MNTTAKTWERDKLQGTLPVENKTRPGRRPAIPVRNELLPIWNTLVISNMANVYKLPEAGAWIIVGVIPFRGGPRDKRECLVFCPLRETLSKNLNLCYKQRRFGENHFDASVYITNA